MNRNSAGFAPDLTALIAEVLIQGEVGLILCPCFALVIVQTVGRDAQTLSLDITLYAADISAVERDGLIALNSPTVIVQITRLQAEVLQGHQTLCIAIGILIREALPLGVDAQSGTGIDQTRGIVLGLTGDLCILLRNDGAGDIVDGTSGDLSLRRTDVTALVIQFG